jgi:hypothetical protein
MSKDENKSGSDLQVEETLYGQGKQFCEDGLSI